MSLKKATKEKKRGKPSKAAGALKEAKKEGKTTDSPDKPAGRKVNWKSLPRPGSKRGTRTTPEVTTPELVHSGKKRRRSASSTEVIPGSDESEDAPDDPVLHPEPKVGEMDLAPRSQKAKRGSWVAPHDPEVALFANTMRFTADFSQLEKIASTNSGNIFRVRHNLTGGFYAVKKISFPHFDESQESYRQLLHEAKTLAQLSHPNIVKYYNSWIELDDSGLEDSAKPEEMYQSFMVQLSSTVGRRTFAGMDDASLSEGIDSSITAITFTEYNLTSETDHFGDEQSDDATDNDFVGENENFPFGDDISSHRLLTNQKVTLYIQMELCSTNLQDYLDQRRGVDEQVSLHIFTQILMGVKYLHEKNVVHRDLRPSNIFIFQSGPNSDVPGDVVKIGDFSVSTDEVPYLITEGHRPAEQSPEDADLNAVVGDYAYASPEQRRGAQCFQSTDIFSLGIILFELFYNCAEKRDQVLQELRNRVVPSDVLLRFPAVSSIILWMMSPDPRERPSAGKVLECTLFKDRTRQEHVFIPKKDLDDLDKRIQSQESTIHQQESIIKEQERRIQELLQKEALRNSSLTG